MSADGRFQGSRLEQNEESTSTCILVSSQTA